MINEEENSTLDIFSYANSQKNSLNLLDFINFKHYGFPKVTGSSICYHSLLGILAVGTIDGNIKIIGQKGVELLLPKFTNDRIKLMEFVLKKDILIAIDENNKLLVYSIQNPFKNNNLLNLNINVKTLYVPNFHPEAFKNSLAFFGTDIGDLFVFDLSEYKFLLFNFNFKSIKRYLSENKIKIKTFTQSDIILSIRLDQTDYSKLFLVYPHFGLFILNLQKQIIEEYYSPFTTSINAVITSFDINNDSSKIIFGTNDGLITIFKYSEKEKRFILNNTIKYLFTSIESVLPIDMIKIVYGPFGPFNDIIILSISSLKKSKHQNNFEGINRENSFSILYGNNYENKIQIKIGDTGNDSKILLVLYSEVSLLMKDLETLNNSSMFPKRKSKRDCSASNLMKFLLALDSNNNIHFYNLENLKIILQDISINPQIWKHVLNQKLTDNPENYNHLLSNIKSFHEISYTFSMQVINSIFSPHEITNSFFYSFSDQDNKNLPNFIKQLIALNLEKNLTYMSQILNITDTLYTDNHKKVYNNSNLIFNPLIGGKTKDDIEDFYGMFVTSSKKELNFYVLTPHNYYIIFSISTEIDLIHPLLSKTVFEEDNEIKLSKIRQIIFQDNKLFNFNVGIDQNSKQKIGDLNFFDINIKREMLCFGDTNGNIAIYKFCKQYINGFTEKDKIISLVTDISDVKPDITYTGFLCYKIFNISEKCIIFLKFIEIENDILIIALDSFNEIFIFNFEKEEVLYSYHINYSNNIFNKYSEIIKSFNIYVKENDKCINNEVSEVTIYFFKHDSSLSKFELKKIKSIDKIKFTMNEILIIYKSKDFDNERKFIKKILSLEDYLEHSKDSNYGDDCLISILFEKYLSVISLKNCSEISYISFNNNIISHNINLFKNEIYISVLDNEHNFILFSVLPELKICFNIKISLPIQNSIINNVFMSLDGHMILTTRSNEFFQAWLTFSEEDDFSENDYNTVYDPIRSCQIVEEKIKLRKKSIFKTPTVENEYSGLFKNLNTKPKMPSEIEPFSEISKSESSLNQRCTFKTVFETEGNDF